MTKILITGTVTASFVLLAAGLAQASGPTSPRIEPEVFGPDCSHLAAIFPWSGCHQPLGIDRTGTGDPDLPKPVDTPPVKETPSDPCASMWTPGRYAVVSDSPCQ